MGVRDSFLTQYAPSGLPIAPIIDHTQSTSFLANDFAS